MKSVKQIVFEATGMQFDVWHESLEMMLERRSERVESWDKAWGVGDVILLDNPNPNGFDIEGIWMVMIKKNPNNASWYCTLITDLAMEMQSSIDFLINQNEEDCMDEQIVYPAVGAWIDEEILKTGIRTARIPQAKCVEIWNVVSKLAFGLEVKESALYSSFLDQHQIIVDAIVNQ